MQDFAAIDRPQSLAGFRMPHCGGATVMGDGADTRIRTGDLPLTRRLLYQLSYAGMALHDVEMKLQRRRTVEATEPRTRILPQCGTVEGT